MKTIFIHMPSDCPPCNTKFPTVGEMLGWQQFFFLTQLVVCLKGSDKQHLFKCVYLGPSS